MLSVESTDIIRYPIRDPFFKMLPRSLSNFMNAFTSSDYTTYPFATTNRKDFGNLLSVYLDATLNPLLKKQDFLQEGWRIGPANPAQEDTSHREDKEFVFKGVVYNEMKGQMSDASYFFYIKFQESIFPAINNSGGDPSEMTSLTYGGLKDFHAKHYRPGNAKLFTYGDTPLADHLIELGGHLDKFGKSAADNVIMQPINLDKGSINHTVKGPIDALTDPGKQYKTSMSWLAGDASDVTESFALQVLSSLLFEGYGSPMYRALIEAGLGVDWSPNTGFDHAGKKGIFSIGLTGAKKGDLSQIRSTIKHTLKNVCEEGVDPRKIEGIFHQLELALKHKTADFGLGMMHRLQPGWFNGVHPFQALEMYNSLDELKAKLRSNQYLSSLINKYLLNENTLNFTMEPSSTFEQDLAQEESSRLADKVENLKRQGLVNGKLSEITQRQEVDLQEAQDSARKEDLSCLPSVHVRDIPRQADRKVFRHSKIGDVTTQWRETATNGLTYFRAVNILPDLSQDLRMFLPLYLDCLMRLGSRNKSVEELEDQIKLQTGGISMNYHSSTSPTDLIGATEGIALSAYALEDKVPQMYELLAELLAGPNFDSPETEGKVRQLLESDASNAMSAMSNAGHSYARRYAEASLSPQSMFVEQTTGLTQIAHTTSLASRPSRDSISDIIVRLKAIQSFAMSRSSNLRVAITCDPESITYNENNLDQFLSGLKTPSPRPTYSKSSLSLLTDSPISSKTLFPLPFQVAHTALSLPTIPYTSPSSPPLQLLAQLLTHKHLHSEIREKGGAYGGGAYSRPLSGTFGYYSYRDPNPPNTLNIMQDAGKVALERKWAEQDLEEAKISVFQSVDAPEAVNEEGMSLFLGGVDEEMEKERRQRLLDCSIEEVKDAAEKYLVGTVAEKSKMVVLGETKELNEREWNVERLNIGGQSEEGAVVDP